MTLQFAQRLLAFVSLALGVWGAYLAWSWWDLHQTLRASPVPPDQLDGQPWRLWVGGALLVWWLFGRAPMSLLLGRGGDTDRWLSREPAGDLTAPDGARLRVEHSGPGEALMLVLVHGWGMDRRTWNGAREILGRRYEVMAYDLAGLGQSKAPPDHDHSVERQADHLRTVLETAGRRRVVLIGHSIGGMIIQSFCQRHAELLPGRVAGIVLANTTHEDPTRTMIFAPTIQAMKPLIIPAMRLDALLEPLAWLVNWQAYLSGATHLAMRLSGFGTRPSREALELVARDATVNRPAVLARGNIASTRWRITEALPQIAVPALVFTGARDIVTLPSAGQRIAAGLRQAQLQPMPQAGHMGPIELAHDYARHILAFADEVFLRGAVSADRQAQPRPHDRAPQEPREWPIGERPFDQT